MKLTETEMFEAEIPNEESEKKPSQLTISFLEEGVKVKGKASQQNMLNAINALVFGYMNIAETNGDEAEDAYENLVKTISVAMVDRFDGDTDYLIVTGKMLVEFSLLGLIKDGMKKAKKEAENGNN